MFMFLWYEKNTINKQDSLYTLKITREKEKETIFRTRKKVVLVYR
jgi:hypothetical protein